MCRHSVYDETTYLVVLCRRGDMLPEVCTLRAPTISRLAHTRKVHWSSGSARCKPAVCTSTHSHANVATDTHTHSHMHAAALNSMPPFPGAAHGLYSVCPFEQSLPTQPLNHWGYGSRAERLFLDHGSRQRFLELKGSQYAHGTSTRRYLDNGDGKRPARLRPAPRGVVSGSPERAEPGSPPVVPWLHINGLAGLSAPSLSRCRFYWLGSAWLLRLLAVFPLLCRSSLSPLPHSISAACGLPHSGVIAADTAGNVVIVSEEQLYSSPLGLCRRTACVAHGQPGSESRVARVQSQGCLDRHSGPRRPGSPAPRLLCTQGTPTLTHR